ncbi:HWE histidine kinase domain-containing protein [Wenxinia saemankumensis]|uniref:histidine kinase n=1 Tax=Wenxinia saemankumensis TaxID=1447782 RepID=A0A1M6BTF0_9RHOB|nr:HWE histidine kinase domain-containing protein [Wenxinia saemankumensis]SHI51977.1 Bacteriophytochrome (light-regulated signal transduction histidine kinase) [Wenxinia saemankumensis]
MTDPTSPDPQVDLTNCDREPIHILGRVQSFGCLIAVSPDWIVTRASTNTAAILGPEAADLIGRPLGEILPADTMQILRTRMQVLGQELGAARVFDLDLFADGRRFDASIHISGRTFVFEFEPRQARRQAEDEAATVQSLIRKVRQRGAVEDAAQEAARGLRALTGLDRVMVYRFEPDETGTVIAEAMAPGMEPYLGLRYPASDIPRQARALYQRSLLRLIGDSRDEGHPVIPALGPDGRPLDLSLAVTRSVSPIHLEYLRNMGVGASLSVSILKGGRLWGLFACHHRTPIHLGYEKRSAIELFAQLFNYELAQLESEAEIGDVEKARALHDSLMSQVSSGTDIAEGFDTIADQIAEVIEFDGIALYSGGEYRCRGRAPTREEFLGLARFLNTAQTSTTFSTDEIGRGYERADSFADRAVGLLALPISRTPRDYIVLFRREIAQTVRWAGNPQKPVETGPNGQRLTPRKSFEAWQEVVRGRSAPWRAAELRAADALRVTLLEVVLKLTDAASIAQSRAQEQQELLIAELNHRVRNILNLIRALVSQGRGGTTGIEEYARVLDARIHALARAHDQLTRTDWTWTPLRTLVETEAQAFVQGKADRVRVSGDAVDLSPAAFSTLALVFHELVTNSAKHGALSDSSGEVLIGLAMQEDGSLRITWRERNGPAVQAPRRRGFGSTIIERSVPFELKGTAELHYRMTGVEAEFWLPSTYVRPGAGGIKDAPAPEAEETGPSGTGAAVLSGPTLVVDDNMIIAMDAADMLAILGSSEVHTAGSVGEALRVLERVPVTFALIDVNLGDELSLPVAQKCAELGIRAILATGYGAADDILSTYPATVVIKKPYTIEHVEHALAGNG